MGLTRTDVLMTNATAIAGLVVLLTLTNIGGNANLIEEDLTQLVFNVVVIFAIAPFAYSSVLEVTHELETRRHVILKRLELKLKEAQEKNDKDLENQIRSEITHVSKKQKKLKIRDIILEENEPTHSSLVMMRIGFLYVLLALVSILIIPQIGLILTLQN